MDQINFEHGAQAEKETALQQQKRPQPKEPTTIISPDTQQVKNALRELRLTNNVPAKDMVEVVRQIYPKYDKTIQSKCERGEDYGIQLRKDAMDALLARFAPDPPPPPANRNSDRHKLTCRLACRLPDHVYAEFQRRIRADGYTMQDWLEQKVTEYLQAYVEPIADCKSRNQRGD